MLEGAQPHQTASPLLKLNGREILSKCVLCYSQMEEALQFLFPIFLFLSIAEWRGNLRWCMDGHCCSWIFQSDCVFSACHVNVNRAEKGQQVHTRWIYWAVLSIWRRFNQIIGVYLLSDSHPSVDVHICCTSLQYPFLGCDRQKQLILILLYKAILVMCESLHWSKLGVYHNKNSFEMSTAKTVFLMSVKYKHIDSPINTTKVLSTDW